MIGTVVEQHSTDIVKVILQFLFGGLVLVLLVGWWVWLLLRFPRSVLWSFGVVLGLPLAVAVVILGLIWVFTGTCTFFWC